MSTVMASSARSSQDDTSEPAKKKVKRSSKDTYAHASPDSEIKFFQDLIRFRTVSSEGPVSGAYRACVDFLEEKCKSMGFKTFVKEFVENKPCLVATRAGTDPSLPGILLNSHYDVVPALLEHWDVEPFEAILKDGKIWGRGTQDMKCVCAQYILALDRLANAPLKRTIHLSFGFSC